MADSFAGAANYQTEICSFLHLEKMSDVRRIIQRMSSVTLHKEALLQALLLLRDFLNTEGYRSSLNVLFVKQDETCPAVDLAALELDDYLIRKIGPQLRDHYTAIAGDLFHIHEYILKCNQYALLTISPKFNDEQIISGPLSKDSAPLFSLLCNALILLDHRARSYHDCSILGLDISIEEYRLATKEQRSVESKGVPHLEHPKATGLTKSKKFLSI